MSLISGFGDIKLNRYGASFLQNVYTYSLERGLSSKIKLKVPKRERKPGELAAKGNASSMESLTLFKEGKTVAEIASLRTLSPMTVEGHLGFFIETGELDVSLFVKEEKIPAITNAVESYGADRLSPLKEILGPDYTYGEIKAVIGWMKFKANAKR
jgi:ATP-dependent DNA helicase RecQ